MAKDKGKTKNDADEFGKPSEAPSGGDGWKLTDAKDRLLLFTPLREDEVKAFGKKGEAGEKQKIIVADVVVIDEKRPEKSEEHDEAWIFQAYVQGSLRGFIGDRYVLGRLRNTEDTSGAKSASGGYYWELEDATAKDVEKARAYLAEVTNPLGKTKAGKSSEAKGGKKSKPAPEPKKSKGKKK